jgi:hypothetical protein
VLNLLTRFKMEDYKPCSTPFQSRVKLTKDCDSMKVNITMYYMQLVGNIIYLTHGRPNIAFTLFLFRGSLRI